MADYAVIRVKGSQYKVSLGEEFLVGKVADEELEAEVLMVSSDGKVKVGVPKVKGAKVSLSVLEREEKGKKLHVRTFKAKSKYRRKIGFRPVHSRLKVEKIY